MSKHNYSQYSNKNKNKSIANLNEVINPLNYEDEVTPEVTVVTPDPEIENTVETTETDVVSNAVTIVTGTVVNCSKLNVRAYPDPKADVVCLLDVNAEIEVNEEKSTVDWVRVCTAAGIEGYCMRKFIEVNP